MFDVPNLDDLSTDPEDYAKAMQVFGLLIQYTSFKHAAMLARQGGNIAGALECERTMEEIYAKLPDWARW